MLIAATVTTMTTASIKEKEKNRWYEYDDLNKV